MSVLTAARPERGRKFAGEFSDLRRAATSGVAEAPADIARPAGVLGTVTGRPAATDRLAAALGYAGRGWKVFPCNANKEPCTQHGFLDATDDTATIKRWWGDNPRANIGIATQASGLVVVDADEQKPGCEVERLGELPKTYTVRTPSGGRHFYFSLPAPRKIKTGNNRLGAYIDVTNYVLAPPSICEGRQYMVECAQPVADLPQHLLDAIAHTRARKNLQPRTTQPTSTNLRQPRTTPPTSANSVYPGIETVEGAVAEAIPLQPRTNNAVLFRLARALLTLRGRRPVTADDEAEAFDLWHEQTGQLGFLRESREHYWEKFLYALLCAKRPLGADSLLSEAWAAAQADGLPPAEAARVAADRSPVASQLLALCWQMSVAMNGGVWFLAGGDAAKLVRCSGRAAWLWLRTFVRFGVLEVVEPGKLHHATRYRYLPLDGGHTKERKLNHAKRHPKAQAR